MLAQTKTTEPSIINGINLDDLFALIGDVKRDAASEGKGHEAPTPPCGVPAVRGTMLPSSICTDAFSQRSM